MGPWILPSYPTPRNPGPNKTLLEARLSSLSSKWSKWFRALSMSFAADQSVLAWGGHSKIDKLTLFERIEEKSEMIKENSPPMGKLKRVPETTQEIRMISPQVFPLAEKDCVAAKGVSEGVDSERVRGNIFPSKVLRVQQLWAFNIIRSTIQSLTERLCPPFSFPPKGENGTG